MPMHQKHDPHSHTHHHHHADDSSHGTHETPTALDKLTKMVEHWVSHNRDHARSFAEWAKRATELGQSEVAALLNQAAEQSLTQNQGLDRALELLRSGVSK
jgi:hypothetical protein